MPFLLDSSAPPAQSTAITCILANYLHVLRHLQPAETPECVHAVAIICILVSFLIITLPFAEAVTNWMNKLTRREQQQQPRRGSWKSKL
jgi:Tfp pilus assembly protein PilO